MSIHQQSDDKFLDNLETEFVFDIKKYGPHSYPRWLEIEKEKRAIIAEPDYYISGISLTFLKPDGKEHTYKYYPFRKKKLTLEDFARVVRSCEDRYLIEIPKASFLTEMVESTNNHKALEEIQIRYKNYVKTKEH